MSLGITCPPPTAPGKKSVSHEIFLLFSYSICYWEIYRLLFFGWGDFSGRNFIAEEICQNSYKKLFLFVLLSLSRLNFTVEMLRRSIWRKIFTGLLLSRASFHREGNSSRDKFCMGEFSTEKFSREDFQ